MKKLLRLIASNYFLYALLIVLQLALVVASVVILSKISPWIYLLLVVLSAVILLFMFNLDINASYKMVWAIIIVVLPLLGGFFFIFWHRIKISRRQRRIIDRVHKTTAQLNPQDESVIAKLAERNAAFLPKVTYLNKMGDAPVFDDSQVVYFASGEKKWRKMLEELQKADKFIFLEYFIIKEGLMWDSIAKILKEKARQGVDVRVLYDSWGTTGNISEADLDELEDAGVDIVIFNPLRPVVDGFINSRDHRKICVIDGNVAFNGGVNLGDEYINHIERFGHWKDTAVMLKGPAVWSFTLMFLKMWEFSTDESQNYAAFRPDLMVGDRANAYLQPFDDQPIDEKYVAEQNYINIIARARQYVYITTPYLIIDSEMEQSLRIAALSGVDVRIVTPGVPDKKGIFLVTRSFYRRLLASGVRIYEYSPGFIHAKMMVSDDNTAVVGTANLDYRSLYLHYECCTAIYDSPVVAEIKADIEDTILLCREIDRDFIKTIPWRTRFLQTVLRLFAPLI